MRLYKGEYKGEYAEMQKRMGEDGVTSTATVQN